MKNVFLVPALVIILAGCNRAPDEQEPAPGAVPQQVSAEDKQAAQDEAHWLGIYNRIAKNGETKFFASKPTVDSIDAANALADKDYLDIQYAAVPMNYAKVHRRLQAFFPVLRDALLYTKMGLQTSDVTLKATGQKKTKEAAKIFAQVKTLAAEAAARKKKAEKSRETAPQ